MYIRVMNLLWPSGMHMYFQIRVNIVQSFEAFKAWCGEREVSNNAIAHCSVS